MVNSLGSVVSQGSSLETQGLRRAEQMLGRDTNSSSTPNTTFSDILSDAMSSVNQSQQTSKQLQRSYQLGDPNVSVEETIVAMNQASLSFQMLAQARNKVVAAYSEVMNMNL